MLEELIHIDLRMSELGLSDIYVHGPEPERYALGYRLLAEVQPEMRALVAACRRAQFVLDQCPRPRKRRAPKLTA